MAGAATWHQELSADDLETVLTLADVVGLLAADEGVAH
jgi:hypothetical protein